MWKLILTEITNIFSRYAGNVIGVILQSIAVVVFAMVTLGLFCAFLIILLSQWLAPVWACLIVLGIAVLILVLLCCCHSMFTRPMEERLRSLFKDM